jgi:DNA-binding response OmpR family regulator/predicted regulator of Ras-like GTPase activity (Roadblock/LC7/MglB family)
MSKQWHILIVLDDKYLNQHILNSLQIEGYIVKGVNSGTEAVHLLWAEEYDVVISDQRMPDTDGFELLQWIRTYRPRTRMIMVGMPGSSVSRTQALENGVVSYLEKPLELRTLKEELRRLLQQTGFSANLDSFDLLDVIQIINMSHKTIAMVVNTGLEEQGLLGFQAGELVWAEYGILRGEEAFFALAAHKNGTITHQPWNEQIKPNVAKPLSRLIFQALQYRSKYEAIHQLTGEQVALAQEATSSAIQLPEEDDTPFMFVEPVLAEGNQQGDSNYGPETPAPEELVTNEAIEWWMKPSLSERPNKTSTAKPEKGSASSLVGHPADKARQVVNGLNGPGRGVAPVNAHKTPAGQRVDLPSWLMDQPTQFEMPAVPRETSVRKTDDISAPGSEQSSGSLPVNGATAVAAGGKASGNGTSGIGDARTSFATDSELQHEQTPNYSALITSLQTLCYSIQGFIATAVIQLNGQPVAQVTADDLDVSPLCSSFSNILQSTLRAQDQGGLGHYENTIITSQTHFILLRLIGNGRDTFQVLITTRDADPVASLEIMAKIEPAIESAL